MCGKSVFLLQHQQASLKKYLAALSISCSTWSLDCITRALSLRCAGLVASWQVGSSFLDQRLNPCPLHWNRGISKAGPPKKSLNVLNFNSVPLYFIELICHICTERERERLWLCSHRCRACESNYAMFWSTINRLLCNRHEPWNRQIKTKNNFILKKQTNPNNCYENK